ncbi:PH domain-containing protein [Arthrobacter sp. VKM Ac-2550]|uniref:PH domain-containing protein n=1 Tax=Crystallibacter permensis TaxID=1938888 RepID=UPI002227C7F0|nr:PH domain-containing protein [Arthrobacter sp. VKM Ac-2550]MCW2130882.1 PH domain-containing protein [Arthrobacter sp. VKM Ac-2550]
MIDFANGSLFKLQPANVQDIFGDIEPLLVQGENAIAAFRGIRDFVVFTDKRLITVNIQGITGKKRDFTSLPYSKVQAFSVETAGTFDLDGELDLWFSGLGKIRLEFKGNVNVQGLSQLIAQFVL